MKIAIGEVASILGIIALSGCATPVRVSRSDQNYQPRQESSNHSAWLATQSIGAPDDAEKANQLPAMARRRLKLADLIPDPAVQTKLHQSAAAIGKETDLLRAAANFLDLPLDRDKKINQLLWFLATSERQNEHYLVGAILESSPYFFPSVYERCAVLDPFMETEDVKLRRALASFLYEEPSLSYGAHELLFEDVSSYLSAFHKTDPPDLLVQMMYGRDPDTALRTLLFAGWPGQDELDQPFIAASKAHDVIQVSNIRHHFDAFSDDPLDQETVVAAKQLASSEKWWARLYVATVASKWKPFARDDLLEPLLHDTDDRVRTSAESALRFRKERELWRGQPATTQAN